MEERLRKKMKTRKRRREIKIKKTRLRGKDPRKTIGIETRK